MMFISTFSRGIPSFSYIANRKNGRTRTIIMHADKVDPMSLVRNLFDNKIEVVTEQAENA